MGQSQTLSFQSLPHSFSCNGGVGVSSVVLSLTTRLSPPPTFLSFQRLTNTDPEPPESGRPRRAAPPMKALILVLVSLFLVAAIIAPIAVAAQSAAQTEALLSNAKALFQQGNLTEADRAVR